MWPSAKQPNENGGYVTQTPAPRMNKNAEAMQMVLMKEMQIKKMQQKRVLLQQLMVGLIAQ